MADIVETGTPQESLPGMPPEILMEILGELFEPEADVCPVSLDQSIQREGDILYEDFDVAVGGALRSCSWIRNEILQSYVARYKFKLVIRPRCEGHKDRCSIWPGVIFPTQPRLRGAVSVKAASETVAMLAEGWYKCYKLRTPPCTLCRFIQYLELGLTIQARASRGRGVVSRDPALFIHVDENPPVERLMPLVHLSGLGFVKLKRLVLSFPIDLDSLNPKRPLADTVMRLVAEQLLTDSGVKVDLVVILWEDQG